MKDQSKQLKDKNPQELKTLIAEKREALRQFRFGSTGARAKDVKLGRTLRKDIARIMTALAQQAKKA